MEYFRRRPVGWRADNRAAIIAMSMGGGKIKPEELFDSLRVLREEANTKKEVSAGPNFAQKFFDKFGAKFSEKGVFVDDKV